MMPWLYEASLNNALHAANFSAGAVQHLAQTPAVRKGLEALRNHSEALLVKQTKELERRTMHRLGASLNLLRKESEAAFTEQLQSLRAELGEVRAPSSPTSAAAVGRASSAALVQSTELAALTPAAAAPTPHPPLDAAAAAALTPAAAALHTKPPPAARQVTDRPTRTPSLGVLAIFKNEAQILVEWVRHYRLEGVSQFVLIDDNSTDGGERVARGLGGDVSVVASLGRGTQVESYRAWVHMLHTDWMLVADLDEFVYARPQPGNLQPTIPQYLGTVDETIGAVVMPWVLFASTRDEHPVSVIDASRQRTKPEKAERNVKTIVRRAHLCAADSFGMHGALTSTRHALATRPPNTDTRSWTRAEDFQGTCSDWPAPSGSEEDRRRALDGTCIYQGTIPVPGAALQLNHYPLQSWEYFSKVKMTRGDVSSVAMDSVRDAGYYARGNAMSLGVSDDELARKRGWQFFVALPESRPWPPESSSYNVGPSPSLLEAVDQSAHCNAVPGGYLVALIVMSTVLATLIVGLLTWCGWWWWRGRGDEQSAAGERTRLNK